LTLAIKLFLIIALMFPSLTYDHVINNSKAEEIYCLATVVYFESRGEHLRGQIAVANTVLNRSKKRRKPVCYIMSERHQFSWHGKAKTPTADMLAASLPVAYNMFMSYNSEGHVDDTAGATHFATKHVRNAWTRVFKKTLTLGSHSFYKER